VWEEAGAIPPPTRLTPSEHILEEKMKVKIFIDFWNLQLSWNEYHARLGNPDRVKIPWEKTLPQVLVNAVGKDSEYVGTHVYASINPKSQKDRNLHSFLQQMDLFPGY
jgi:hypothetical protein